MDIENLKGFLDSFSCCVYVNSQIIKLSENGVKPLIKLLNENKLKGAVVADRVIGRAAAFLMIKGGVKYVYTPIISMHAEAVFNKYNISYSADNVVPFILNRKGDGMCPMEALCLSIDTPEEAYEALQNKILASTR